MDQKNNIKHLKNSLTYQMSLGGRELYHSNVWCFLMGKDHDLIRIFFPDFNGREPLTIEREWHHMDLVIRTDDEKAYILGNKLKSLPDAEQLKRYSAENAKGEKVCGRVYTGLWNTLSEEEQNTLGWHFLHYRKIAAGLEAKVENSHFSDMERKLILEYCRDIRAMADILDSVLEESKGKLTYPYNDDLDHTCVRLQDLCVKCKAADFAAYLRDALKDIPSLYIRCGFNRKKATIDIFCKGADPDALIVGLQLECLQYRRYVWWEKSGERRPDGMFSEYAKKQWFDGGFDPNGAPRTLFGKETGMRPRNGKRYDGYGDNFIYQYADIPDGTPYDDLAGWIRKDLAQAEGIRKGDTEK